MKKTKSDEETTEKVAPAPTDEKKPIQPDKKSGPLHAMEAVDLLTAPAHEAGSTSRAHAAGVMQRAVGNSRMAHLAGADKIAPKDHPNAKKAARFPPAPGELETEESSAEAMPTPKKEKIRR